MNREEAAGEQRRFFIPLFSYSFRTIDFLAVEPGGFLISHQVPQK
jgi:hypothetical protein